MNSFSTFRLIFDNVNIKFYFSERVVGRNWTEKIVVLHSDSRQAEKITFSRKNSNNEFQAGLVQGGTGLTRGVHLTVRSARFYSNSF